MKEIIIRETTAEDLRNIEVLWNCGETMKYVGFPNGIGTDQIKLGKWLENLKRSTASKHFSVYHESLGYCGETYYRIYKESNSAVMDIKLLPHVFGKGIASYALSYALTQVFTKEHVERAIVAPHPENLAAVNLYHKLGFVKRTPVPGIEKDYHENYMDVEWSEFRPSRKYMNDALQLTKFKEGDMKRLWELSAKEDHYKWNDTNAPYFYEYEKMTYEDFCINEVESTLSSNNIKAIYVEDILIGMVSQYWKDKGTRWLEVGIVIYDELYWGKGIATIVLNRWINEVFSAHEIERVGLTTWSGNPGMIHVAKKIGMKQEAVFRKVRYFEGVYYDSISYGILREEVDESQ